MSNQLILWGSVIAPWFTLLFLPKEEVKRYMPVALFGALITTIVGEVALALDWWTIKDAVFPFYHMPPFTYGGFLVGIIWLFRLTYGRFLLFMLANALFDYVLVYHITGGLMVRRGIIELVNITPLRLLIMNIANAALLYGYQMWQEEVLVVADTAARQANLRPAAAKPSPEEDDESKK